MTKHILYLASGNSRRFGTNKLLAELNGKPLYRHGLDVLQTVVREQADCTLTVVSQYAKIRQQVEHMGIPAVDSPDSPLGMSYTIRAGISSLQAVKKEDFLLFVVADQPYLQEKTIKQLLSLAHEGTQTARAYFQDRPGNPALFSAKFIPELLALQGDAGGGAILKRHECTPVFVSDLRELMDIDTLEDLQQS